MKLPELHKSRWSLAVIGVSFLCAAMFASMSDFSDKHSNIPQWIMFFIGVSALATAAYNHDNR